jgi:hypothetical protein
VDAIPPVQSKRGRRDADRPYDSQPHRERLRAREFDPQITRRRMPHESGLGRYRWVVKRTFS